MRAVETTEVEISEVQPTELQISVETPPKTEVVANCIILNERGEILLLQRDALGKKQLEVPGGGLRPNETPLRAAVRETGEEVGGIISIEAVDKVITTRYKRHGKRRKHVNFLARVNYTGLFPKQKMHKSIGFYSFEQLEQMEQTQISSNVKQLLKAREQGRLNLNKGDVSRRVN
jgi:ADP-ribose pyrophosphatase YjhB (NUDIX family)